MLASTRRGAARSCVITTYAASATPRPTSPNFLPALAVEPSNRRPRPPDRGVRGGRGRDRAVRRARAGHATPRPARSTTSPPGWSSPATGQDPRLPPARPHGAGAARPRPGGLGDGAADHAGQPEPGRSRTVGRPRRPAAAAGRGPGHRTSRRRPARLGDQRDRARVQRVGSMPETRATSSSTARSTRSLSASATARTPATSTR